MVPFTVDGVDHALVAAVLGYEHGIGVRSGCFCAQPYVAHLLDLEPDVRDTWQDRARVGDKRGAPGMVRASLGLANDGEDVDRLLDAVRRVVAGDVLGTYVADEHGEYRPSRPAAVAS